MPTIALQAVNDRSHSPAKNRSSIEPSVGGVAADKLDLGFWYTMSSKCPAVRLRANQMELRGVRNFEVAAKDRLFDKQYNE